LGITRLASKAQLAQARDEIRQMLTRGLSQITPRLDAGLAKFVRGSNHRA